MHTIKIFIFALLCLIVVDTIWLSLIAKNLYFASYRPWFRLENDKLQVVLWAAGLVYLLLALAIVVFVFPLAQGSIYFALLYGAIIGCIIYGVYDFTCLAIFKDWPVTISFIDWAWGTFLCGFSSMITVYLAR